VTDYRLASTFVPSSDCSAVKSAVVGLPVEEAAVVVAAVSFSDEELSLRELSLLFPQLVSLKAPEEADGAMSRDLELSSFCRTINDAYPSDNFFMKFQASSRVIRVQSVLLTDKISSPTFNFPLLSAAPPVKKLID
jgi:hypothetical protein